MTKIINLRDRVKKRKLHQEYKYNLNLWLSQLDYDDYNTMVNHLPWLCCVSKGTFANWRYIKQNDSAEIPHSAIVKICNFLQKDITDFQIGNKQEPIKSKL